VIAGQRNIARSRRVAQGEPPNGNSGDQTITESCVTPRPSGDAESDGSAAGDESRSIAVGPAHVIPLVRSSPHGLHPRSSIPPLSLRRRSGHLPMDPARNRT
jgi:hypothetical protein